MKFKKSMSIILSATMVANFTCAQLVTAQGNSINTGNEVVSVENTTNDKEIISTVISSENQSGDMDDEASPDKKETKRSSQEKNNKSTTDPEEDMIDDKSDAKTSESGSVKVPNSQSKQDLINRFLLQNAKYFPSSKLKSLPAELQKLSVADIRALSGLSFNDPSVMTLVSIFFGGLGIDRMLIGKIGTGVLKLLLSITIIPSTIWWIVDICKISKMTKKQNWKMLSEYME